MKNPCRNGSAGFFQAGVQQIPANLTNSSVERCVKFRSTAMWRCTMGLRIATNVQSLAAQRYLGLSSAQQKETLEHLASGSRISRAADDAAGLAISENIKGQIRSIRQDVRNASDGISMIQTAEGGMNEVG